MTMKTNFSAQATNEMDRLGITTQNQDKCQLNAVLKKTCLEPVLKTVRSVQSCDRPWQTVTNNPCGTAAH